MSDEEDGKEQDMYYTQQFRLSLEPEVIKKLKEMANKEGLDVTEYAGNLLRERLLKEAFTNSFLMFSVEDLIAEIVREEVGNRINEVKDMIREVLERTKELRDYVASPESDIEEVNDIPISEYGIDGERRVMENIDGLSEIEYVEKSNEKQNEKQTVVSTRKTSVKNIGPDQLTAEPENSATAESNPPSVSDEELENEEEGKAPSESSTQTPQKSQKEDSFSRRMMNELGKKIKNAPTQEVKQQSQQSVQQQAPRRESHPEKYESQPATAEQPAERRGRKVEINFETNPPIIGNLKIQKGTHIAKYEDGSVWDMDEKMWRNVGPIVENICKLNGINLQVKSKKGESPIKQSNIYIDMTKNPPVVKGVEIVSDSKTITIYSDRSVWDKYNKRWVKKGVIISKLLAMEGGV